MVAKKDLRAGGASRTGAGEEAVATFLASMALDGSRSTKELGRPPTAFEIRVYKVSAVITLGQKSERSGLTGQSLNIETSVPGSLSMGLYDRCVWYVRLETKCNAALPLEAQCNLTIELSLKGGQG